MYRLASPTSFSLAKKHNNKRNFSCFFPKVRVCYRFQSTSTTTQTQAPSIKSFADIASYKKKAHALYRLRKTPHVALSTEAALQLITDEAGQGKIPENEKMTREEAAEFLRNCHEAGAAIISPPPTKIQQQQQKSEQEQEQQMVFPDPLAVFQARKTIMEKSSSSSPSSSETSSSVKFSVAATNNHLANLFLEAASGKISSPVVEKGQDSTTTITDPEIAAKRAAINNHRFWAFVSFIISAQMLLFAYWTFLVYDWDAMEPFTYFVGCVYMVGFFAYFVFFGRAHTFAEMDRFVIRSAVKKACVKK